MTEDSLAMSPTIAMMRDWTALKRISNWRLLKLLNVEWNDLSHTTK
jgi:hypothetical protein